MSARRPAIGLCVGVARILGLLIALGPLALGPLGCGGPSGASAGASRARRDRAGGASIPLREVRAVALDSSRALVVAEALEGGPILAGVATIRGERWEAASLGLEPLPGVEGRPRALARGRRGALLLVDGEEGGRLVLIHDEPTLAIETLLTLEGEAIERGAICLDRAGEARDGEAGAREGARDATAGDATGHAAGDAAGDAAGHAPGDTAGHAPGDAAGDAATAGSGGARNGEGERERGAEARPELAEFWLATSAGGPEPTRVRLHRWRPEGLESIDAGLEPRRVRDLALACTSLGLLLAVASADAGLTLTTLHDGITSSSLVTGAPSEALALVAAGSSADLAFTSSGSVRLVHLEGGLAADPPTPIDDGERAGAPAHRVGAALSLGRSERGELLLAYQDQSAGSLITALIGSSGAARQEHPHPAWTRAMRTAIVPSGRVFFVLDLAMRQRGGLETTLLLERRRGAPSRP